MTISNKEYRELLKDEDSSDERILKRIEYLESFFRNIIRLELEKFSAENKEKIHNT
jgi:predicted RNA methylase